MSDTAGRDVSVLSGESGVSTFLCLRPRTSSRSARIPRFVRGTVTGVGVTGPDPPLPCPPRLRLPCREPQDRFTSTPAPPTDRWVSGALRPSVQDDWSQEAPPDSDPSLRGSRAPPEDSLSVSALFCSLVTLTSLPLVGEQNEPSTPVSAVDRDSVETRDNLPGPSRGGWDVGASSETVQRVSVPSPRRSLPSVSVRGSGTPTPGTGSKVVDGTKWTK